jgi:hypothetical protein
MRIYVEKSDIVVVGLAIGLLTTGIASCGAAQNPKCPDVALATIEARYVAEVVAACQDYGGEGEPPVEECPDYPRLSDKYDAMRKEWVECR